MSFSHDLINEYCKTLIRKNISNIENNKFLKKPYLEKYIIKLSIIIDDNYLKDEITCMLENEDINKEDLFLFISNNIDFNINQKKSIEQLLFFENEKNKDKFNQLTFEILLYQIKYFRFYQIITELLFDNVIEHNELYNFIFIYVKNKHYEIRKYNKKNIRFSIFYYYISDLFRLYESIFNLLNYFEIMSYDKKEIFNFFLKNLFQNWYIVYKKDISENKVNEKIKNYILNKGILSRILCLPNI